jgi:hypothetical protein
MTNKELQDKLRDYPDNAPIMYCLMERNSDKEETDRQLSELDKVDSDGVHILLIEYNNWGDS